MSHFRAAQLISFTEVAILFGYQFCVAIYTLLWFKAIGDEAGSTGIFISAILANTGIACIQVALNLYLLHGVEKRHVSKCKIWYYTTLSMYVLFVPLLFFGVIYRPILVQWLGVAFVYIVYRAVSLRIMKDFITELTNNYVTLQNKQMLI